MNDCSLHVRCDGSTDDDDDFCEAEFTIESYEKAAIDPIRVAFQLAQRGWVIRKHPTRQAVLLTICPLHSEED